MCGRFRLTYSQKLLARQFDADLDAALKEFDDLPRYNIAPTQPVLAIKQGKKRTITKMRWGLIPAWAKDERIGNRNINARSETIREVSSFRELVDSRRCLIPADGFYEWKKSGKMRQPFCFEVSEGGLFAFAGLWDTWRKPNGETIESCTILTTTANDMVSELHDRMPVIVPPEKYELWLSPDIDDAAAIQEIFKPYDPGAMEQYPVDQRMNNVANDDPASAAPIVLEPPKQSELF